MGHERHEFTPAVKRVVAQRVGYACSYPNCTVLTIGPHSDPEKALNIGVAAHIHAASEGGPRYDPNQSEEDRKSHHNAIWMCQNHGHMIDADDDAHSAEDLQLWKALAEKRAKEYQNQGRPNDAGTTFNINAPVVNSQLAQTINNFGPKARSLRGGRYDANRAVKAAAVRAVRLSVRSYMGDADSERLSSEIVEAAKQMFGWKPSSLMAVWRGGRVDCDLHIFTSWDGGEGLDPLTCFADFFASAGLTVVFSPLSEFQNPGMGEDGPPPTDIIRVNAR